MFTKKESTFGLGGKVVVTLCKSIAESSLSVVYFDNYFTSLDLIHYLRNEFGIFSLGVIASYRSQGYDLPDKKELKEQGRGSFSQIVSEHESICIVRWQDNKPVTIISSFADAYPTTKVKRYSKELKKKLR